MIQPDLGRAQHIYLAVLSPPPLRRGVCIPVVYMYSGLVYLGSALVSPLLSVLEGGSLGLRLVAARRGCEWLCTWTLNSVVASCLREKSDGNLCRSLSTYEQALTWGWGGRLSGFFRVSPR